MSKDKLIKRFNKFVEHEVIGDGDSYTPVSDADFNELYQLIYDVIEVKWSGDADSDRPINVTLINRHHNKPLHAQEIPYNVDETKPFEYSGKILKLQRALAEISRELELELNYLARRERRITKQMEQS